MTSRTFRIAILAGLVAVGLTGCDVKIDRFPDNRLYGLVVARRDASDVPPDLGDVETVVKELFGTPDDPLVCDAAALLLNRDLLMRAAGPVASDQAGVHVGLYREHCAACHGVEGGGTGPAAALLNPYPRDFRPGVFKFKSTGRSDKPTHGDLTGLLHRGIPGTAMPSFATVSDEDLESLIQYLIYLSMRGETERKLIDRIMSDDLTLESLGAAGREIAAEVAASWQTAEQRVVDVPKSPVITLAITGDKSNWWEDEALVAKGRELFHGPLANCASCHGPSGDGNATTLDFDDWTKEYTTKLGISPSDRDAMKPMRLAGALRPRQTLPRRLQWSVFHGDSGDEALYRRLVTGIAGSPMPGLLVQDKVGGVGVTPEDVWAIIAFIRSLSGIGFQPVIEQVL